MNVIEEDKNIQSLDKYVSIMKEAYNIISYLQAKGVSKSDAFNIMTTLHHLLQEIVWK